MSAHPEYELIATTSSNELMTRVDADPPPTPCVTPSKTGHLTPIENIPMRSLSNKDASSDTLLIHGTEQESPTPPVACRKPHMLHPSMWLYEILSLTLAALILVALVIVLAVYNRKPSPVVGGITLNTIVAFASTLFRICLMVPVTNCICQLGWTWFEKSYRPLDGIAKIDMASRGPLGSIHMLFQAHR
jgi:hypothetical protein